MTGVTLAATPPIPTILAGTNAEPAADVVMTLTGNTNVGDVFTFSLDDSAVGTANCLATGDTLGFTSTPAVTATVPVGAPAGTVPATFTVTTSAATASACAALATPVKNVLTLTAQNNGTGIVTISGIAYDVGNNVAGGGVRLTLTTAAPVTVPPATPPAGSGLVISNANIALVDATGNVPAVAINSSTVALPALPQAVSNFTFVEKSGNGLPSNTYCVNLSGRNGTASPATFDPALPVPTAAISGGDAISGTITVSSPTQLRFEVLAAGVANFSTITISGIRLIPGPAVGGVVPTGIVFFQLSPCAGGTPTSDRGVATTVAGITRLGGGDRYTTAQIIAENTAPLSSFGLAPGQFRPSACDVILARADLFPDALASSYLAGSGVIDPFTGTLTGTVTSAFAPILLAGHDTVPLPTLNAIKNLRAKRVFIVGGTDALGAAVETQLGAQASLAPPGGCQGTAAITGVGNLSVERIGGADRYETARRIADRAAFTAIGGAGTLDISGATNTRPVKTAILASGEKFPDALAAGPMAFQGTVGGNGNHGGFPLILTNSGSLHKEALAALTDLQIQQVIIVGGTDAVSASVATSLPAGTLVTRLGGTTREETATLIATFERARGNIGNVPVGQAGGKGLDYAYSGQNDTALVSRNDDFPDALSGASRGGFLNAPILLTPTGSASTTTTAFLTTASNETGTPVTIAGQPPVTNISILNILGGVNAVSAAAETGLKTSLTPKT